VGESVPEWCRHTWWYWFNAVAATCAIPLNYKPEPDLQVAMEGDWWHNYSFLSRHSGGAHFALVDGSVKFVSASIDRDTYRALATVDASEAVPEF
jgi:prepilin-type processing-associated H-X9-DG protein